MGFQNHSESSLWTGCTEHYRRRGAPTQRVASCETSGIESSAERTISRLVGEQRNIAHSRHTVSGTFTTRKLFWGMKANTGFVPSFVGSTAVNYDYTRRDSRGLIR
jgi:hypothetical protein